MKRMNDVRERPEGGRSSVASDWVDDCGCPAGLIDALVGLGRRKLIRTFEVGGEIVTFVGLGVYLERKQRGRTCTV